MSFKVYTRAPEAQKPTMRMFSNAEEAQTHAANRITEGDHVIVTSSREVVIFDNAAHLEAAQ